MLSGYRDSCNFTVTTSMVLGLGLGLNQDPGNQCRRQDLRTCRACSRA